MTPERWQRVHSVFLETLEADPSQRGAVVERACAGDSTLQAQVLELLDGNDKAARECFLEASPWILDEIPMSLPAFGDYERIECVGHGGMGAVYRAWQRSLGRWVALKMSLPHSLATDEDRQRFRTEAESMAKVRHPNIVRVHEVGEQRGQPYLSMELIEGTSLAEELPRFRDDQRGAAGLVQTLARAVHHAHLRGLLHRDLKPENILLDEEGRPLITDFGLAKRADEETSRGRIVGTAAYMSPEQADPDRDETALSDVYGLGAILYALLTGLGPHRGKDHWETLRLVRERAPDRPSLLNPGVDRDLEALCLKCLAPDPSERHPSARALADDLGRWLDGKETSARRWSLTERCRAWVRKNPVLAWSSAAIVLLLALAATLVVKELVDVVREPLLAQRALARQQAETIRLRLMQLAEAVNAAATEPGLARSMAQQDLARLQRALVKVGDRLTDLSGRSPFESWFVLNLEGEIVARWPKPRPEHDKVVFRRRDYFRGTLARARVPGKPRVYVSRVYLGHHDARYKFGIGRALLSKGKPVGVIVASVTTSPRLGLPMTKAGTSKTALIARVDSSAISRKEPRLRMEYLLLMHPAYRRGTKPLALLRSWAVSLNDGIDERYLDPASAIDPSFGGTWLAGLARVEGTEFIVVSQRRYAGGTSLALWSVAAALALLILALLWLRKPRGRPNADPAEG